MAKINGVIAGGEESGGSRGRVDWGYERCTAET